MCKFLFVSTDEGNVLLQEKLLVFPFSALPTQNLLWLADVQVGIGLTLAASNQAQH